MINFNFPFLYNWINDTINKKKQYNFVVKTLKIV